MRAIFLLPLGLVLTGAGCYRYVPITSGTPSTGSEFRARLTDDGSLRLTPILGNQVAIVEGRVSSANDSAFVVSMSATTNKALIQTYWTGESITLPRSAIQTIEARQLNRRKTWFVVALGVVGGFFAAKIFDLFEGSAGGNGGGPPPPPT
jgi:hypothetical protein